MQQDVTDIILQSSVNVEKRDSIVQNIQIMFDKFNEWDTLNNSIVVSSKEDVPQTKLAKQARLTIKKARTDGEKYFDSKRSEVQALKAEYDAEDKLYLKLKQSFSSMCKERESALEEKELYVEKILQQENELRNLERYNKLLQFTETPQIYSYENLDDILFNELLKQLEKEKAISLRLQQEAEENMKRVNAMKSRLMMLAQYIPNFYSIDFESMSEEEAEQIYRDANIKREEAAKVQQEKEAELEALRLEKAKNELAEQRFAELSMYKYGIDAYSGSISFVYIKSLTDAEYNELFDVILKGHQAELKRIAAAKVEDDRRYNMLVSRQKALSNVSRFAPFVSDAELIGMDDLEFGEILRVAEEKMQCASEAELARHSMNEQQELEHILTNITLLPMPDNFSEKGRIVYRIFVSSVELLKRKGLQLIRKDYGTEQENQH